MSLTPSNKVLSEQLPLEGTRGQSRVCRRGLQILTLFKTKTFRFLFLLRKVNSEIV